MRHAQNSQDNLAHIRVRFSKYARIDYLLTGRLIMEFETEAQLVDQFQHVYGTARDSDWVWLREFSTSCGIADLIGVSVAQSPSTSPTCRASLGLVPSGWAYTLLRLPSQVPFTVDDLAKLANVSTSSARS